MRKAASSNYENITGCPTSSPPHPTMEAYDSSDDFGAYKIDKPSQLSARKSQQIKSQETNSLLIKPVTPKHHKTKGNNIWVLWVTILIVTITTAALAVAAVLSRSLALTADVVQNAVDLSTYGVNLYAEYQAEWSSNTHHSKSKRVELAAATFSVLGLIGVGAWVLWAALDRFHTSSLPGHFSAASGHIDAHLLLAFTVIGFGADMFVATIFCKYSATNVEQPTKGPMLDLEGTPAQQERQKAAPEKNVNMISAGAHVMTDAIRSIVIVFGAFLIFLQHHSVIKLPVEEEIMDGILSCFVVGCMALAVLFVLKEIYHLVQEQVGQEGSVSKFICAPSLPGGGVGKQRRGAAAAETEELIREQGSASRNSTAADL